MARSTRKFSIDVRLIEEAKEGRMAKLMTQIELMTKYIISAPIQKVNVIAANYLGYKHEDAYHNNEEKAHYINNHMAGFV